LSISFFSSVELLLGADKKLGCHGNNHNDERTLVGRGPT
jgi:hypothetical protein